MRLQSLFRTRAELAAYRHLRRLLSIHLCKTTAQLWKLNPNLSP